MLQLRFNLYRNPIFWVIAALTAIALLLGLGLAYFSANLSSLFQREESYREYLNMTDNLKYNLLNAETGQRGYLISQDELYLRPYEAALPAIEKNLKDLNDSPTSRMYEDETQKIIDLVNRKMDELALTIKTLQTQGQDAAFAIVNTNEGISDMDTLRMLIRSVTDEQNTQLQSEVNSAQTQVKVLGLLPPIVALPLSAMVTFSRLLAILIPRSLLSLIRSRTSFCSFFRLPNVPLINRYRYCFTAVAGVRN